MKPLLALGSAFVRRRLALQARRSAHDAPFNPGPPITWDYSPVPCQPYKVVYNELQSKFNTYLAIAATLFATSLSLALYDDLFAMPAIRKPQSYYKKEPVLVTS